VKNSVVVETGATIGQKVLDGGRRFRIECLNNYIAVVGVQSDHDRYYAAKYIGSMGVSTGRVRLLQTGGQFVVPGLTRSAISVPMFDRSACPWLVSDQTIMSRGLRSYRPSERLPELPIDKIFPIGARGFGTR